MPLNGRASLQMRRHTCKRWSTKSFGNEDMQNMMSASFVALEGWLNRAAAETPRHLTGQTVPESRRMRSSEAVKRNKKLPHQKLR